MVESDTITQLQVSVINNLGDNTSLTGHCRSPDRDIGIQTVEFGAGFGWNVDVVVRKSEAYYCELSSGKLHGHFGLFETARDYGRCGGGGGGGGGGGCVWRVDWDGLYLYVKKSDDYVLQFRWP
ncbi:S-protein homolog 24-like [Cornus florida]|uniref:S-protein homolog 24-like n=1 Tax=Cornus florida TaxID=4283 RepID=UPI002899A1DF|nr:S-protein homolog 24-like [Cornus florida]